MTDPCRPDLCALGAMPHAHCPCGLPMAAGARLCDLCRSEALHIDLSAIPASRVEWDGQTYPSLRLNRPTGILPTRYAALLQAIVEPVSGAQPATTGEAA